MRIGVFGGSFNPVHNGHIHLAKAAAEEFGLDKVLLVPSRISPHRSMAEYASGEDRLEMLRLVSEKEPVFEVCDYELCSDRVSYTIYTIEHLRQKYPNDELFLLVGSDMFMSFDKWYRFDEILANASLCVVSRNEGDAAELAKKAEELEKFGKIYVSESFPLIISSTEIREKIAKNEDFTCYLDENVVQYIRLKGLYSL